MASKSLFDFIENTEKKEIKTEQTYLLPKEEIKPIENIKFINVLNKKYEVIIE